MHFLAVRCGFGSFGNGIIRKIKIRVSGITAQRIIPARSVPLGTILYAILLFRCGKLQDSVYKLLQIP